MYYAAYDVSVHSDFPRYKLFIIFLVYNNSNKYDINSIMIYHSEVGIPGGPLVLPLSHVRLCCSSRLVIVLLGTL